MAPTIKNGTHVQLNDGSLMPLVGLGCWQVGVLAFYILNNRMQYIHKQFMWEIEVADCQRTRGHPYINHKFVFVTK